MLKAKGDGDLEVTFAVPAEQSGKSVNFAAFVGENFAKRRSTFKARRSLSNNDRSLDRTWARQKACLESGWHFDTPE